MTLQQMRCTWRLFTSAKPGERFKTLHTCRAHRRGSAARRCFALVAGLALMAVGLIMLPAPGPGMLVVAMGGLLAAQESLAVAKALDWMELKVRGLIGLGIAWWRKAAWPMKAVCIAAAAGASGAGGLAVYEVFR